MTFAPLLNSKNASKRRFLHTLQQTGLMTGLTCCCDAGDALSAMGDAPSGEAPNWAWHDVRYTLSPAPTYVSHWGRGSALAVTESIDPVFWNTPGRLDATNSYGCDGTQYFHLNGNVAGNPWINNLHKDGAKFGMLTWIYLGAPVVGQYPMIFHSGNGTVLGYGVQWDIDSNMNQSFSVYKGDPTYSAMFETSPMVLPVSKWVCIGVSINEAANYGFFFYNGAFTTWSASYISPGTAAASANPPLLGGWLTTYPDHRLRTGTFLAGFFMWDQFAPSINHFSAFFNATRGRFAV